MPTPTDFETWESLGRNAYGTIHRGIQFSLKRDVAIFELGQAIKKEADGSTRFWDEVTTLAQLTDDGLVPVFAVDRPNGWIVMELMSGHCGQILEKPQSPEVARSILRQALGGLARLHEAERVHGDVRPHSLLIHRSGRIKLSFALGAAVSGTLPYQQRMMKYVAPELISPAWGEYGPRADLYSLAFSVLELMLGPKFDAKFPGIAEAEGDGRTPWMRWHASDAVLPSVAELVPAAGGELVEVLDRLLRKKVGERYASAGDALADLKETRILAVAAPGVDMPATGTVVDLRNDLDKIHDPASRFDVAATADDGGYRSKQLAAEKAAAARKAEAEKAKAKGKNGKPAASSAEAQKKKRNALIAGGLFAAVLVGVFLLPGEETPEEPVQAAVAVPTGAPPIVAANRPPVFDAVADRALGPDEGFDFSVRAVDPDESQAKLTYAFDDQQTTLGGVKIDTSTGRLTYAPGTSPAAGEFVVAVKATDAGKPPLAATTAFRVRIRKRNVAPEIRPIESPVVLLPTYDSIGPLVSFKVRAQDPDDLGAPPRFALAGTPPVGATLDPRTGLFTWSPPQPEKLEPAKHEVTVEVFDAAEPALSTKQKFEIVVERDKH